MKITQILRSVRERDEQAVMVQRHGTYMTGHALARMAGDNAELLARNYARLELLGCGRSLSTRSSSATTRRAPPRGRCRADGDPGLAERSGTPYRPGAVRRGLLARAVATGCRSSAPTRSITRSTTTTESSKFCVRDTVTLWPHPAERAGTGTGRKLAAAGVPPDCDVLSL